MFKRKITLLIIAIIALQLSWARMVFPHSGLDIMDKLSKAFAPVVAFSHKLSDTYLMTHEWVNPNAFFETRKNSQENKILQKIQKGIRQFLSNNGFLFNAAMDEKKLDESAHHTTGHYEQPQDLTNPQDTPAKLPQQDERNKPNVSDNFSDKKSNALIESKIDNNQKSTLETTAEKTETSSNEKLTSENYKQTLDNIKTINEAISDTVKNISALDASFNLPEIKTIEIEHPGLQRDINNK